MSVVASFSDVSAFVADAFKFTVKKNSVFMPDNFGGQKAFPFCGLYREFEDGRIEPFGSSSVSHKYVPHTLQHMQNVVEATRHVFSGELSVQAYWREGHLITVKPTRESAVQISSGDVIVPMLSLFGGYAGKPISAKFGWYRAICKNYAIFQTVYSSSATIRHTLAMSDKLDALIEKFGEIKESWNETIQTAQRMRQSQFETREILAKFLGEKNTQKGETQLENRIQKILERLISEKQKLGLPLNSSTDGWLLFNAVQGAMQHNFARKEDNSVFKGLDTWEDANLKKLEELILAC